MIEEFYRKRVSSFKRQTGVRFCWQGFCQGNVEIRQMFIVLVGGFRAVSNEEVRKGLAAAVEILLVGYKQTDVFWLQYKLFFQLFLDRTEV